MMKLKRIFRQAKAAYIIVALLFASIVLADIVSATGISVDAGLTPAAGRWMFRSQVRYMHRDNYPPPLVKEMKMYMVPFVVAYGVRSDLTIMMRQAYINREMIMGGMMASSTTTSGRGDFLLLAKYRLARINKPTYTIGIAPTLAIEMPTGSDLITSETYDLQTGLYISGRYHTFGTDLSVAYVWNGMGKTTDTRMIPGDEFKVDMAIANQFSIGDEAMYSLAPVLEFSYSDIAFNTIDDKTVLNTGESYILLSPGLKFTVNSLILEGLVQFPIWQEQTGDQTERVAGFLFGFRYML